MPAPVRVRLACGSQFAAIEEAVFRRNVATDFRVTKVEDLRFPSSLMASSPLPASSSKDADELLHPLPRDADLVLRLRQISSVTSSNARREGAQTTGTTGTTLWLGAQVMACYLRDTLGDVQTTSFSTPSSSRRPTDATTSRDHDTLVPVPRRKRAIELGSGVGYLSLCLASWGWDVVATDIEPVTSTVLRPNVDLGLNAVKRHRRDAAGKIGVTRLDWLEVARDGLPSCTRLEGDSEPENNVLPENDYDMIITTDTLYATDLVQPLWTTLRLLSERPSRQPGASSADDSHAAPATSITPPPIYIALENRDPDLIGAGLEAGRAMGFEVKRIGAPRVARAVDKAGWGWRSEDWAGVEIWKARWKDLPQRT